MLLRNTFVFVLYSSVTSTAAATAAVVTAATAGTTVAVEKDDGDKNDPEALVVLKNIT